MSFYLVLLPLKSEFRANSGGFSATDTELFTKIGLIMKPIISKEINKNGLIKG